MIAQLSSTTDNSIVYRSSSTNLNFYKKSNYICFNSVDLSSAIAVAGDSQLTNIWQTGLNCKYLKDNLRVDGAQNKENMWAAIFAPSVSSLVQMCAR